MCIVFAFALGLVARVVNVRRLRAGVFQVILFFAFLNKQKSLSGVIENGVVGYFCVQVFNADDDQ